VGNEWGGTALRSSHRTTRRQIGAINALSPLERDLS
jgi:hypothetical protein